MGPRHWAAGPLGRQGHAVLLVLPSYSSCSSYSSCALGPCRTRLSRPAGAALPPPYSVAKSILYPVELANVGGKAEVTVEGVGTQVKQGANITGTITGIDTDYNAYVFVDGVKVAVDETGAFSGTANNSAKVAVAYAKKSAWFTDPFVKNQYQDTIMPSSEGVQWAVLRDGKWFLSHAPGNGGAGICVYDVANYTDKFGERVGSDYFAESTSDEADKAYWGRTYGVAQGIIISCNRSDDATKNDGHVQVRYYADKDGKPVEFTAGTFDKINLMNGETALSSLRLYPVNMNADATYFYGCDGSKMYQFAIGKDENGKVISLNQVKTWDVTWRPSGMTVVNIGGKEIIYAKGCEKEGGKGLMVIETSGDSVKYLDANLNDTGDSEAFTVCVTGIAAGTPHITFIGNTLAQVYALTVDGLDIASSTPIFSATVNSLFADKTLSKDRFGGVVTDDEAYLLAAVNGTGNHPDFTLVEKKPAQLIVRGRLGDAADDDTPVDFNAPAEKTWTAPTGKEITEVTINGTAVAGFTAADSYTFKSDALTEYTLVKMTVADKTFDLTFTVDDAPVYTTNDVVYGAAFADIKPEDPTVEGKSFTGWTPVVDTIVADNTFTAQFTNNIYYVTFYTNNAVAATVEYEYDATDARTIEFPTIEGVTAWSNETYDAEFVFHSNIANFDQKAYAVIAAPEPQGVEPGAIVDATGEDDAKAKAEAMVIVPGEGDAEAKYYKGVAKQDAQGNWYVEADVNPAEVTAEIKVEEEEKPIEVTATEFKAVVKDPIPGLFYGFVATEALGGTNEFEPVVQSFVRAKAGEGLTLTAPKAGTETAKFFKLSVRAKLPADPNSGN